MQHMTNRSEQNGKMLISKICNKQGVEVRNLYIDDTVASKVKKGA